MKSDILSYSKQKAMYYWVIFFGLILHIMFEIAFIYIKKDVLIYYNLVSIAVFGWTLIHIKKDQKKAVFVSFFEAMIFFAVATVVMGWDYNFQNWLIALVFLSLTVPFPERKIFYILAIVIFIVYLALYFTIKLECNFSKFNFLNVFFLMTNICGVFGIIFLSERLLNWSKIMEKFFLQSEVNKMKSIVGTDELTGLANRHKMNIILEDMNTFIDSSNSFYIAFADLDGFKFINDTYGHEIGDKVLVLVSNILKQEFRNEDVVARWGGEEFLILLKSEKNKESLDDNKVMSILNRVRKKIEDVNIEYKGEKIFITMTFGGVGSKGYKNVTEMINEADVRMYKGKRAGKNRVVI